MTFDEWFDHKVETKIFNDTEATRYIAEASFGAGMKAKEQQKVEKGKTGGWHYTKDKDFPKEKGRYLVWRDLYGMQYPEILSYDGRFWITGKDNADSVIVAWMKIEPPEEDKWKS